MRAAVLIVVGAALAAESAVGALSPATHPAPGIASDRLAAKKARKRRKKKTTKPKTKTKTKPKTTAAEPRPSPTPTDLPPPPALAKDRQVVGVLPLQAFDVTDEITRAIEQALITEVDEIQGMTAVSPRDVLNDLGNYGFDPAVCRGEIRCLATAGRYARCHLAIETRIAAIGGTLNISMRLMDTESGLEVGRVADPISEDPQERSQELHRFMVQLLAPETYVGSLDIKSAQQGAEIHVDDRLVGTTPLDEPIASLTAGPHILRITKPGYADVNQFVDVIYKRNSTITVDLENATISGWIVEQVSTTGFGTLFIMTSQPGVEIRVDGEPKGSTPLDPMEKVEAGQRRLSLRKEGFEPFAEEVEVIADQRTELAVTLAENGITLAATRTAALDAGLPTWDELASVALPLPPAPPRPVAWSPGWKFWTGVGAGSAAALSFAVAGFAGAKVNETERQAAALIDEFDGVADSDDPVCTELNADNTCKDGALSQVDQRGREWSTVHVGTLVGGAVLAAVGAGFVLWDLMRESETPEAETRTEVLGLDLVPLPGGGQVVLSGSF